METNEGRCGCPITTGNSPFELRAKPSGGGISVKSRALSKAWGFCFRQGRDPYHWIYYHPELKQDPIFRYPCNLFRPHGARRSSDKIGNHDRSRAKQMIDALQAVRGASRKEEPKNESKQSGNE